MNDVTNLRSTTVGKVDQLNAVELLGITRDLVVTEVRMTGSAEQPVSVHYEGDNGKPFKPCLTMRRLLIFAWGEDGTQWVGRVMRVYNEQTVKWAGKEEGGVRISHLSHIPGPIAPRLTESRGSKKAHPVQPLVLPKLPDVLAAIDKATNKAGMDAAKGLAEQLVAAADIEAARAAYGAKVKALKASASPAPAAKKEPSQVEAIIERMEALGEKEAAWKIVETERPKLSPEDAATLETAYVRAYE